MQEKLSMEELDLSPRNSAKAAREVLSRASMWAGGPGRLSGKRHLNCPVTVS